ncbi:MAG TPA: hypothetical protein VH640_11855 [Bryobacteraceae bacterium]
MNALTRIVLGCLLAAGSIYAQRGGGMGHGGFGGGGFRGGFGGFHGGFGGFRGGFGGFRGGFVNHGFGRGFVGRGFWGWPGWRWGGGFAYYWPGSYSSYYPYYPYSYSGYPADYGYGYGYGSSPNVIVVYPQPQTATPAPAYYQPSSVIDEYGENGYAITPSRSGVRAGSPTYLIALKNHVIYDAVSYSVKGDTIYFVTIANEQKSCPMIMVDRSFSMQLNHERGVNLQLP